MERDGSNSRESDPFDDRCVKKMVFKKYVELFKEGRELVSLKEMSKALLSGASLPIWKPSPAQKAKQTTIGHTALPTIQQSLFPPTRPLPASQSDSRIPDPQQSVDDVSANQDLFVAIPQILLLVELKIKMILVTVMIAGFVCCACTLNQRSSGSGHVFDDSPLARAMFRKADRDQNEYLTYGEFQNVFRSYDNNNFYIFATHVNSGRSCSIAYKLVDHIFIAIADGLVTSAEFLDHWQDEMNGTVTQGLHVFTILDVYHWFVFNSDWKVTEGEIVVQWVKI